MRRISLGRAVALFAVVAALAGASVASGANPVVMAAGDIACANPGTSTPGDCSQVYTSNLMLAQRDSTEGLAAVLALGDTQYDSGALADFRKYFDPTWGRLGSLLHPALGNHEYAISGAAGYFDYFSGLGVQVGNRGQGWYSFDVGRWHLIALNSSNGCTPVQCTKGSPQELWLQDDLAHTSQPCILAYWHHPLRYAAAEAAIWQDLYDAGADLVLVGHDHTYQPPVAHDASGRSDPNGPREVVVGTGGKSGGIYGVLKLTLRDGSYDWRFVGTGATDSGSAACHGAGTPAPAAPRASFASTTTGLTATFEDKSTGVPTSWSWTFGDGATSTRQSPVHTYAKAGIYTVELTAANGGGSSRSSAQVTVVDPPPPPPPPIGTSQPHAQRSDPGPAVSQPASTPTPDAAANAAKPALAVPTPTGPLPVGVRSALLTDRTRTDRATHEPRALPIRVWYPARAASGQRARYLPVGVQQGFERAVGLPAGSLDVDPHALERAPARGTIRGIVVATPAAGSLVAQQSALMADLASRGYAVVAIDHPLGSDFGRRVRDVGVVLARLSRLVPQRRRGTRIAIIGHALGGAVAAEALRRYPQLRAGVDIDGSPRARVARAGLSRPFGLLLEPGVRAQAALRAFVARLRGPHPIVTLPIQEYGFTDIAAFNAQAAIADAALGQRLERQLPSGTVADPAAGLQAIAAQRSFIARFMGRYVAR